MQFTYNGVTIGDTSADSIIGKPVFSGTRETFTISIKFLLVGATESAFYDNYINYKDKLEAPGLAFTLSPGFTIDPDDSNNYGTTLNPSLDIIGADTDSGNAKTCQYTISFLWNNLLNGYRNLSHAVEYTINGKKIVTISVDLSKNSETSALDNFKDNFEDIANIVLAYYGYTSGSPNYRLMSWSDTSTDPKAGESSHDINYISVQASYEQVFFSEEADTTVSATLINPILTITPERFTSWSINQQQVTTRKRLRVNYQTTVKIDSEKAGGDGTPYDYSKANTITTENFLSEIYESVCKPRIEQYLENQGLGGTFEVLDGDINYNPSSSFISVNLLYDNELGSPIVIAETLETETIHGYDYKVIDPNLRANQVYVDYPGTVTYATVSIMQEYRAGQTPIDVGYVPANGKLLREKTNTSAGESRIKQITDGFPEYETTTVYTYTAVYVISEFSTTSEDQKLIEFGDPFADALEQSQNLQLPKAINFGGFTAE